MASSPMVSKSRMVAVKPLDSILKGDKKPLRLLYNKLGLVLLLNLVKRPLLGGAPLDPL